MGAGPKNSVSSIAVYLSIEESDIALLPLHVWKTQHAQSSSPHGPVLWHIDHKSTNLTATPVNTQHPLCVLHSHHTTLCDYGGDADPHMMQ